MGRRMKGATKLRFEVDEKPRELEPGDFVDIPAHLVEWTSAWIAVFYKDR